MMIGVIAAMVAGVAVLLGWVVHQSMRMTAKLMFTPDMDEEWMARAAVSSLAGKMRPRQKRHCHRPNSGARLRQPQMKDP